MHCNYFRVTHPSLVLFPENLQKPPVLQVSFFLAKHKKQSRRAWLQGTLGGASGHSFQMESSWVNTFHGENHTRTFSLLSVTVLSRPLSTPVVPAKFLKGTILVVFISCLESFEAHFEPKSGFEAVFTQWICSNKQLT